MNDLKGIIEDCNKSDLVSDKIIKKIIEIIGQEEWQDLHDENNDICTTMGELIITLKGIAELEKENAELKEQQFSLRNERNTFLAQNEQYEKDLIDFNDQLTKAKEIIHKVCYEYGIYDKDLMEEAKQFLNSEVEK
jgi:transcriptional/translational regulatory protein YebC/TACO1